MIWARGHRSDWDHFASESGEPAWGYEPVLDLYRQIEDWQGVGEPNHRGRGGPVFVQPAPGVHPLATAAVMAARAIGIPTYQSPNGPLMEDIRGAAITDMRIRNGKRLSVFRTYTAPYLEKPNLTVVPRCPGDAGNFPGQSGRPVSRSSMRARSISVAADTEVVLSLGAIHTPKVLMQSGVGDEDELRRVGVAVRHHLPGVGRNFQDHYGFDCRVGVSRDRAGQHPGGRDILLGLRRGRYPGTRPVRLLGSTSPSPPLKTSRNTVCRRTVGSCSARPTHPKSRGRLRLSGPDPSRPDPDRSQRAVPPRRSQDRDRLRRNDARDRQFRGGSSVRRARGDAGRPDGRRTGNLFPQCGYAPTGTHRGRRKWVATPCRWSMDT